MSEFFGAKHMSYSLYTKDGHGHCDIIRQLVKSCHEALDSPFFVVPS